MDKKQAAVCSPFQDKDLMKMARVVTKYTRFLDPAIVAAVSDDNRRYADDWSARLSAQGVDPRLYLWGGSACCIPGVRRYVDAEKGAWKRGRTVFKDALALDSNEYPRWIWATLLPERAAELEAQDYIIFHPLNHRVINAQVQASLEVNTYLQGRGLYGLFTSAANLVYAPNVLIALMNSNHWLRTLLLERQAELYGAVSAILPPQVRVRRSEGEWNLRAFEWAPCEGAGGAGDASGVASVRMQSFLAARRVKVDELLACTPYPMRLDVTLRKAKGDSHP
jgi:hypothetical protein